MKLTETKSTQRRNAFGWSSPILWIAPGGNSFISSPSFHFVTLAEHANEFGFNQYEINKDVADYLNAICPSDKPMTPNEVTDKSYELAVDTDVSHKYISAALKKGWVRVYKGFDAWSMWIEKLTSKNTKTLETFFLNLKNGSISGPSYNENDEVKIYGIGAISRSDRSFTVEKIINGSLEESQKMIRKIDSIISEMFLEAIEDEDSRKIEFWFSPNGRLISLGSDKFHALYAIKHAEEFGLSQTDIENIKSQYKKEAPDLTSGLKTSPFNIGFIASEASDNMLEKIYKKGWLRVDYFMGRWGITVGQFDDRTRKQLTLLGKELLNHTAHLPSFISGADVDVNVSSLKNNEYTKEMSVSELSNGKLEEQFILESVTVHGIKLLAYVIAVGEAYAVAPKFSESAVSSWIALIESDKIWYNKLIKNIAIEYTEENPTPNADDSSFQALIHDVLTNRQLSVWKAKQNFEHPGFSSSENDTFRAVHDVLGHSTANSKKFNDFLLKHAADSNTLYKAVWGAGFKIKGEMGAYMRQSRLVPQTAIPALFMEIIGQSCFLFASGNYAENKVALIDGVDYKNIGECTGDLKRRMDEIEAQYADSTKSSIQTRFGPLDKTKINWSHLSRGTAAGNIT